MRIAFSGTHRSGKSTLLAALSGLLPGHEAVDEPYHLLEEEGHEFAASPSLEDYEAQLERSIACMHERGPDVLFDRCPADFLAYLAAHADAEAFDLDGCLARARAAIQTLDLLVLVPIEQPDRIAPVDDEHGRLEVDERLKQILLDDSLDLDVEVIEERRPAGPGPAGHGPLCSASGLVGRIAADRYSRGRHR